MSAPGGVLVIAGPTAAGKTELALSLARRFDAEIVGADSRQIYRGMPIGTAAPTPQQRAEIPHHCVEFLDPGERYSAARYVDDAVRAIGDIHARGRRAIVVGGTGFYVRALCGDVALGGARRDDARARLVREAATHPPDVLHAWLASRRPERARALAPSDSYRVLRALEQTLATGGDDGVGVASLAHRGIAVRKCVLVVDDAELERRIAARVDAMLAAGFVAEADRVGGDVPAADAVGYPLALAYLGGMATEAELRAGLVRSTRRYAKRQRTWFRREPRTIEIASAGARARIEVLARESLAWT